MSRLSNDGGWDGGFYVEGVDQSLLRDGVEAVRASTVIAEPYVMADKSLHKLDTRRNGRTAHNFDRVVPSHWTKTSRSFAVVIGESPALTGSRRRSEDGVRASADSA